MTQLLEEAVARVQALPEDEQNRAAEVLIAFAGDAPSYSFTSEQIAGIESAMRQADQRQFADDARAPYSAADYDSAIYPRRS